MAINAKDCRFHNTLAALRECWHALHSEDPRELSEPERDAAEKLFALCEEIAEEWGEYAE